MKSDRLRLGRSCQLSLPTRERGLKYLWLSPLQRDSRVAPYTGAWIEISSDRWKCRRGIVAPYTGAWIEIKRPWKPPVWILKVAPYTGAWIEIQTDADFRAITPVAPYTGAWIEIGAWMHRQLSGVVAPYTGALQVHYTTTHRGKFI